MYKAIHFKINPLNEEYKGILSALLDIYNFEGIYENNNNITAYINDESFLEEILTEIQSSFHKIGGNLNWEEENIPDQNWNEIWESNFDPIIVHSSCAIRAPFHPEFSEYDYEIVIEPKMSFGTGHHQTTQLMIEHMLELDFKDRIVLDMGCGTGVLGIFASLKKASKVVAVDIDKWAYENALENAKRNKIGQISILHGSTELVLNQRFDIVLANINLNVLIKQIRDYSVILKPKGILLISGILIKDINALRKEAEKNKFTFIKSSDLNDWIALMFERN